MTSINRPNSPISSRFEAGVKKSQEVSNQFNTSKWIAIIGAISLVALAALGIPCISTCIGNFAHIAIPNISKSYLLVGAGISGSTFALGCGKMLRLYLDPDKRKMLKTKELYNKYNNLKMKKFNFKKEEVDAKIHAIYVEINKLLEPEWELVTAQTELQTPITIQ